MIAAVFHVQQTDPNLSPLPAAAQVLPTWKNPAALGSVDPGEVAWLTILTKVIQLDGSNVAFRRKSEPPVM